MNKTRNVTKENKRNEKKSEKGKTNKLMKFKNFRNFCAENLFQQNANDCRSTAWSVEFNSLWLSFGLLAKKN